MVNRLILALNLDMMEELENENQSIAHQIMGAEQKAYGANPRAAVFMAIKVILANATIATQDEWRRYSDGGGEWANIHPRIIAKEIWEHWCKLKGRRSTLQLSRET